jgi:hypothetical protein
LSGRDGVGTLSPSCRACEAGFVEVGEVTMVFLAEKHAPIGGVSIGRWLAASGQLSGGVHGWLECTGVSGHSLVCTGRRAPDVGRSLLIVRSHMASAAGVHDVSKVETRGME